MQVPLKKMYRQICKHQVLKNCFFRSTVLHQYENPILISPTTLALSRQFSKHTQQLAPNRHAPNTITMKEVIVSKGPTTKIQDSPVPTAKPNQVVIKIHVSGSNPKDWKIPEWMGSEINTGDDIAGTVHAIGSGVTEFKPGDRVAAFHEMGAPHGSFAEYGVAHDYATFRIPEKTSFEEAATIPLAAMTAALGLYQKLRLPLPWQPATEPLPLIVYGGASAVGAFGIKLATLSNIHPIIAVAGRGIPFVQSLIDPSKGDAVVDYRKGDEATTAGIADALEKAGQEGKAHHLLDAVSEKNSYQNVIPVLQKDGKSKITNVLPGKEYKVPEGIEQSLTRVGSIFAGIDKEGVEAKAGAKLASDKEFGNLLYRFMGRGLGEGFFQPHPYEVVPGGLAGVQTGLKNLKEGNASAVKYVFRIDETEGVAKL